jgi:hypothetical protein
VNARPFSICFLNHTLHVITGLVPVIPIAESTAPHIVGMAGLVPAMT